VARLGVRAASLVALVVLSTSSFGCAEREATVVQAPPARGEALEFAFGTVQGDVVTSETIRGRVTVLLFMTTFDLASQAQAKQLEDLLHLHAPRFNAIGVVMEPPKNAELVRSFGEVLGLSYPIALADEATLAGEGPFGGITSVPSWVILDRDGRTAFVRAGGMPPRDLEQRVREAEH
jgi:hypothetical protein